MINDLVACGQWPSAGQTHSIPP